ncbi:CheR family methyltransferase [Alteromonas lipolytica]|uniref:Chemotaxis protein methyltransferase n=1 Tax=Alteromonas lipolytica TaxID=1856405 RepID=A0A1E8FI21_9ALTE|nr:CheR family methyltransferase [Alteromonas lipolytica]OFI35544.1 chemotaxis protein CheR [Alteromonas lipolytica]GGF77072.1 chemotaxis protein methyltransferase [Alteromonas lipolytica]
MEKPFAFTLKEFNAVRQKIRSLTGINLADSKDNMVYSRLARRLRALNIDNFQAYLKYLDTHKAETEHFINALTTNLTSFFRESHHFDLLKEYLASHPGPLRIWCTASSSGEEPYSIAMTCAEARGSLINNVKIYASDIDSRMLERAQAGIYPIDQVEKLSPMRRKQFFHRGTGANAGKARIIPELRQSIHFFRQNLLDSSYAIEKGIDIVFCRNVMIYFDKPTQEVILKRILRLTKPDAWYIAGHSENFSHLSNLLRPKGKTVYLVNRGAI